MTTTEPGMLAATLADLASGPPRACSPEAAAMPVEGAPWLTLGDLHAIAAAARAHLAERARLADDRDEWQDPETGRAYVAAMRAARAWVASGSVAAHVTRWPHAAAEALDAAVNQVLAGRLGACYLADRRGYTVATFGTSAARELGAFHRARDMAPFGDLDDAGSGELMTHLGETGPTTADNHDYRRALVEAYAEALAGPPATTTGKEQKR